MGDVVKLFRGRHLRGKAIPKPVECKECGDDIETARLQVMPQATRCIDAPTLGSAASTATWKR